MGCPAEHACRCAYYRKDAADYLVFASTAQGKVMKARTGCIIICTAILAGGVLFACNEASLVLSGASLPKFLLDSWTYLQVPIYTHNISYKSGSVYDVKNTSPEEIAKFYKQRLSSAQWKSIDEHWYFPSHLPDDPQARDYCSSFVFDAVGPFLQDLLLIKVVHIIGWDEAENKSVLTPDTRVFYFVGRYATDEQRYTPCKLAQDE